MNASYPPRELSARNTSSRCLTHSFVFIGLLLGVVATTTAWADDDDRIDIDRASWSNDRDRLSVRGDKAPDRTAVTIRYGNRGDNGAVIGTTVSDGDGDWSFRISGDDLGTVPCDVTAQAAGVDDDDREVSRAPNNCSNDAGGGVTPNIPPTADANGPYDGTTGVAVNFSSAGSNDSDGGIDVYAWTFGDGASSNQANPSHIYSAAGNYTVTLTVTDNLGATAAESTTATISNAIPDNNPPVCTINSPSAATTSINVGGTVNFTATVTDEDPASLMFLWDFGGGAANSTAEDAGPVTFDMAGTFTVTFTSTDNANQTCAQQQRTIQVNDVVVELPGPVGQENNNGLLGRDQPGLVVLGANDLGMHCADQDDRIFSVLPPFNVLHAQVIERGSTGDDAPSILTSNDVSVVYSAASNPNDPVGTNSINSTSANFPLDGAGIPLVYKGNFWDVNPDTGNPQGFDTYSPLFFGLLSPAALTRDLGLPAPETTLLTACLPGPLGNGAADGSACAFAQQAMAGISAPYLANVPQGMHFDSDTGFFADLLGGINGPDGQPLGSVVTNVNWFRADGIPILPVDDSGRDNAYPLVRVQAVQNGNAMASTDVVLPVAAEADCQGCHLDPNALCTSLGLTCEGQAASFASQPFTVVDLDNADDLAATPGDTDEQKVLNAAKINILRLHDAKHNAVKLDTTLDTPPTNPNVVCASCHYSPALDLAQVGPQNLGETQQEGMISMSRAMHGHHGDLVFNGQELFPDMPPPDQRNVGDALPILEQTCYQCHPGKRTKCLRGAMGGSGIVCQDCHGNMTQVGDDFTGNPNGRVPWASEPKCQSCHTGDEQGLNHPNGAIVAPDGIRLLQAYTASEHINNGGNATPIVSSDSRWAENETLYRLSGNDDGSGKGHGGLMCEGCHGSTHAIWPNANPNANDNVAADQLQGHTGTLIECDTCHTSYTGTNLNGPHGMHPVGNTNFVDNHDNLAESNNGNACRACHGNDGEGTVLSQMAQDRVLECDERTAFCPDGNSQLFPDDHQVGCTECHDNEL